MPGKVHKHGGKRVYHRPDGALKFHGKRHARYIPELDRKRKAGHTTKKNYPHAGDRKRKHRKHRK